MVTLKQVWKTSCNFMVILMIIVICIFALMLIDHMSSNKTKEKEIITKFKDRDFAYVILSGEKVQIRSTIKEKVSGDKDSIKYDVRCQDGEMRKFNEDELKLIGEK